MLTVPLIKLLKAKEILSSSEVFVFTECIKVDGNKIKSPFGVDGTMTIRGDDHTLVNYVIAYGKTITKDPYLANIQQSNWKDIYVHEKDWKKRKKYI